VGNALALSIMSTAMSADGASDRYEDGGGNEVMPVMAFGEA